MSRHLALTYVRPDSAPGVPSEPFTFTIRGVPSDVDGSAKINAERTFTAVDVVPGIVALDLGRAADPEVPEVTKMGILHGVITRIVIAEDQRRFANLLRDALPVIDAAELMHYMQLILEEVAGRPTEGQQPSAGSLPETRTGLTAGSGNGAATPSEGSPV